MVDAWRLRMPTDWRMTEDVYTISLPCEPNSSSGELKKVSTPEKGYTLQNSALNTLYSFRMQFSDHAAPLFMLHR